MGLCGLLLVAVSWASRQDQVRSVALVPGMPEHTRVTRILLVDHRLLIGTNGRGLWELDQKSDRAVLVSSMSSRSDVVTLAHVPGRTLIGTADSEGMNPYESSSQGNWVLPDGDTKLLQVTAMPESACPQVFTHFGHLTLIATYGHGLWTLPDGSLKATRIKGPPDKDPIAKIYLDGNRAIVPTYYHGIWVVEIGQTLATPLVDPSQNKDIEAPLCFARLGDTLFVGLSVGGLWRIRDGSTRAVRVSRIPDRDYVREMIVDDKRLIIGAGSGLYALSSGSDTPVELKDFSHENGVLDLARMGNAIYAGTYDKGVWRIEDGSSTVKQVPNVPDGANAHDLLAKDGYLLCGDSNCLSESSGDDIGIEGLPSGRDIYDLTIFDGKIFYATHSGLLSVALEYELGKRMTHQSRRNHYRLPGSERLSKSSR